MSEENLPAITEDDLRRGGLPDNVKMAPGLAIYFIDSLFRRCKNIALGMSEARGMVGDHLINNPSACLAIISRSITWNMDPYAVAQATYAVKGKIGYEGKLCQAILENSGAIEGQLKFEFFGDWDKLRGKFKMAGVAGSGERKPVQLWIDEDEIGLGVKVSALVKGEATRREEEFFLAEMWPRNSTLWILRPKQQMRYATARAYGNLAVPGIIMGVPFDVDPSGMGGSGMVDITPPKPQRSEFDRSQARDPAMGDWTAKMNFATTLEEVGTIRAAGLAALAPEFHKTFEDIADTRAHQIEGSQKQPAADTAQEEEEPDPMIDLRENLASAKTIPLISNIRAEGLKNLPEDDHTAWNAECDARAKAITEPAKTEKKETAKPSPEKKPEAKPAPEEKTAAKPKDAGKVAQGPEGPFARGMRLLKRVDTKADIQELQKSISDELSGADLQEWKQACQDRLKEI